MLTVLGKRPFTSVFGLAVCIILMSALAGCTNSLIPTAVSTTTSGPTVPSPTLSTTSSDSGNISEQSTSQKIAQPSTGLTQKGWKLQTYKDGSNLKTADFNADIKFKADGKISG